MENVKERAVKVSVSVCGEEDEMTEPSPGGQAHIHEEMVSWQLPP
jgi:hypothetical protein